MKTLLTEREKVLIDFGACPHCGEYNEDHSRVDALRCGRAMDEKLYDRQADTIHDRLKAQGRR